MGLFERMAHRIARRSDAMGEPRFEFLVDVPTTVTRPGHHFNIKKATSVTRTNFGAVRGGWIRDREDNPEGLGRTNERVGQAVLFHWKHDKTYGEIRALLSQPGAVVYFDGVRCTVTQVFEDKVQDATVVEVERLGEVPASQDSGATARTRTLGLLGTVVPSLLTGLIERWEMDEAAGLTRQGDLNVYDLTDENASVGQTAGAVGNAADFASSGDILTHPAFVIPNSSWTLAVWVQPSALPMGAPYVFHHEDLSVDDSGISCYVWLFGDGTLAFEVYSAAGYAGYASAQVIQVGTRYLVVMGYDEDADDYFLTVNNVAGTVVIPSTTGSIAGTRPSFFGNTESGGSTGQFNGWMQKAAFWGVKLSTAMQTQLWNGGDPLPFEDW